MIQQDQKRPTRRRCGQQARPCMSAWTKQTMRFLHETPRQISNRLFICAIHDCAHNKTLYLTETMEKMKQKAHAVHATLSPQLSVDLQTQHFCTTNWDCALSASSTSRVLRSPFVNSFHEQGMGSRQLRDKTTTAALANVLAFKYIDNVARVRKTGQKTNRENRG